MRPSRSVALCAALLAGACASSPQDPPPASTFIEEEPAAGVGEAALVPVRDARAEEVVRSMAEALKKAGTYSLRTETWSDEESADGTLLALPAEARLLVRRPDGFFLERTSGSGVRRCWYDGSSFTLLDVSKNLFARIDAPKTIEETVDLLADRYGVVMPLADLLAEDPAESYGRVADRVDYLGTQPVRGVNCHHISYEAPWLRWQIWIAAEGDPLPRRVQIIYSDEPGEPRFLAYLDDWKLGVAADPSAFTFSAPEGAREIEVAPKDSASDESR